MNNHKLTTENILLFLQNHYNNNAIRFAPLATGMFSQAFSFWVDDQTFVARFNQWKQDFLKDKYASEHFACTNIPIPPIVQLGKYNDTWHYAISPLCAGKTLDQLSSK